MTAHHLTFFRDAYPTPAPIGPPADSYVVTMESARDILNAIYIDSTKNPAVAVLRNGDRIALNVDLCCGCDAALIQGFCKDCM